MRLCRQFAHSLPACPWNDGLGVTDSPASFRSVTRGFVATGLEAQGSLSHSSFQPLPQEQSGKLALLRLETPNAGVYFRRVRRAPGLKCICSELTRICPIRHAHIIRDFG